MALSEAQRLAAAEALQQRLPRLIFAALDTFPLADGRETGLVVLAVRSLPAPERLDTTVASILQELEQGSHRPPVQLKARQISLKVAVEASCLDLAVNWHDSVDFSRLLQKGLPSAVEALCHSHAAGVLYATSEWWELREALGKAGTPVDGLITSKPYMKACVGAALSLLHQKEKRPKNADKGSGYQPAPMIPKTMETIHLLAKRASSKEDAGTLDAMAGSCELSVEAWRPLLQKLSSAAEAATPLPKLESLDVWCQKLRDADYDIFRQDLHEVDIKRDSLQAWQQRLAKSGPPLPPKEPSNSVAQLDEESAEAMKQVESLLPAGSELVFLAQTGSFMYDLQVETSDMDFTLIYQAVPESLLSLNPPTDEFSKHVHQGFATDKKGVIEYSGRELGSFITLLAKGNPKNVELLFSNKPAHRSWAWQELLGARQCFLTLRCARQYLGFISERLFRARDVLKAGEGDNDDLLSRGGEFSKLLYHATHKMLDLGRILQGGCPVVTLSGEERQMVLKIRLQRPKMKEAHAMLERAEDQRAQLASDLKVAEAAGALPAEVDAQALIQWLWSVRVRMVLGVISDRQGAGIPRAMPVQLSRTRSSEEQQAIKDLVDEIEASEKIKVVIAGYGICSRTMGTNHAKSDHDIKCIFVHPREAYFGLRSLAATFKHQFPRAAGGSDVEISGWEARHALQMLAEDNPTVIGLLSSPAFIGEVWREKLHKMAMKLVNRERLMFHWFNHSRRNFQSYIKSADAPLRKRYVHVLRPLLNVAWQRRVESNTSDFPPMRMVELLAKAVEIGAVSADEAKAVTSLINKVEELPESLPRCPQLDALILRLLEDGKVSNTRPNDVGQDWHQVCVEMVSTLAPG